MMGVPTFFLGMNLSYRVDEKCIGLSQGTYIQTLEERFQRESYPPRKLPAVQMQVQELNENDQLTSMPYGSLVGALLFVSVCTRPDIAFVVGVLMRSLKEPRDSHWLAALGVLDYLRGTKSLGITLGNKGMSDDLVAYSDSDWGADVVDRKSVSGIMVLWGTTVIEWKSKKQNMVATSTTEAETHAAQLAAYSVMSIRTLAMEFLNFLNFYQATATWNVPIIFIDNQPTIDSIKIAKGRTRHYDIKLKFLSDCAKENKLQFAKVQTQENIADILTKVLKSIRFQELAKRVVSPIGEI
jgi:hypothetical protein